jgi:hypothetical protein
MRSEGGGKFELTLRSIATLTPYRYTGACVIARPDPSTRTPAPLVHSLIRVSSSCPHLSASINFCECPRGERVNLKLVVKYGS